MLRVAKDRFIRIVCKSMAITNTQELQHYLNGDRPDMYSSGFGSHFI